MIRISKDDLWKGAIEDFIVPFIEYFYPTSKDLIDWKKPIQFLDTELSRIIKGLKKGSKTADKLVKVYLKDGNEKWFLIHVEIQSQPDQFLGNRMHTMYYRIKDKYGVNVAPLAILAYKGAKESNIYEENFWGVELMFKFKTYNIFNEVESGNINMENIFGLIIKSVYIDLKYSENEEEKYTQKLGLIDNFFGRKSSPKEFEELLNFITTFIRLNESFDTKVKNYIIAKTNSKSMGLKELFKVTLEKEVKREVNREVKREVNKRERIIAQMDEALLEKDEALLEKDEALLEKDEALLEKDEALLEKDEAIINQRNQMVCRSFKNGIEIPMIVNITNLSSKKVKSILKNAGLI